MTDNSQALTSTSIPKTVSDPDVTLRLELGRATLSPAEIDQIRDGHIVPLDADANGDITVMLEDHIAARGRLVVVNGQLCVQLSQVFLDNLYEDSSDENDTHEE